MAEIAHLKCVQCGFESHRGHMDDKEKEERELLDGVFSFNAMKPSDPAFWMLQDGVTSTPVEGLYRETCYICRDPEFAQMGLPLCYPCKVCKGHVPADDSVCENGHDQEEEERLYQWSSLVTKLRHIMQNLRRFH